MSTIAADPLALMPRGDGAVTGAAAPAATGDGADFALALADLMSAEAAPASPDGTAVVVPVPAAASGVAGGPLALLDDLGRIAVPKAAVVEGGDVPTLPINIEAVQAVPEEAVPSVDLPVPEATVDEVSAPIADEQPLAVPTEEEETVPVVFQPVDGTEEPEVAEDAPETADEEAAPLAEMAEAVTVAVAAVVAAPIAAQQQSVKSDASQGDAGAESVRMAGAAALMAPFAKPREAKPAATDAPKPEAAPEEAATEETEAQQSPRDKTEVRSDKPVPRAIHAVQEHAPQAHAERRASEAVTTRVEAARAPDPAAAPAPVSAAVPVQPNASAAPVAMDRPGWEGVITERIAAELSEDGQQIDLELTPDNLGTLKIRLEVSDGQAQVRFVTETPEAARLIQQNEHRLSESLSRAGLNLGGHESGSRDAQQQQGDRSGRPAPRGAEIAFQRSGEPRLGMVAQRAQAGLVNLMA